MPELKICTKCTRSKELTEFAKGRRWCRQCCTAAHGKWRAENRAAYNEAAKQWRANNRSKCRAAELKHHYGLSVADYDALLAQQGGACVICSKPHNPTARLGRLFVDHCHRTGKVRGLLCSKCNLAIGHLDDDPSLLERAVAYLRRS